MLILDTCTVGFSLQFWTIVTFGLNLDFGTSEFTFGLNLVGFWNIGMLWFFVPTGTATFCPGIREQFHAFGCHQHLFCHLAPWHVWVLGVEKRLVFLRGRPWTIPQSWKATILANQEPYFVHHKDWERLALSASGKRLALLLARVGMHAPVPCDRLPPPATRKQQHHGLSCFDVSMSRHFFPFEHPPHPRTRMVFGIQRHRLKK